MSTCTINGEKQPLPANNVGDMLAVLNLGGKKIAVELNGEIIPKSQHHHTTIIAGDTIEIISAVGGG